MKYDMITALVKDCHAKIAMAKMNVYILLNNPVGVGDHPNVMGTIQNELDIISQNQGRLSVLQEEFRGET
tara:strand:- start:428 stop:637 length:210 start_codon:yes stop_codon:yes gene_type:complete